MTNDHTNEYDSKMARDSGGDSVPLRSERGLDHTTNSQSHASPEAGRELQRDPFEGIDFDKLYENPLLLARITAYLQENHLHLPILTPDRKEMAAMKEEIPELYQVYVDGLQKSVDADYIQRTHPYTEPLKNVNLGRKYGLTALSCGNANVISSIYSPLRICMVCRHNYRLRSCGINGCFCK